MNRVAGYVRSHHIGLLALFIALSGTAYAASLPRNSVKSKQIKDGQVKTADLGSGAATGSKIGTGAVTNAKIGAGAVTGSKLAASEPWHEVGATGEQPFHGDWGNVGGADSTAAYYRDPFGVVHLKGIVASTPPVAGGVIAIFGLPLGYRPEKTSVFEAAAETSAPEVIATHIYVTSFLGTVEFYRAQDSPNDVDDTPELPSFISLDGISFRCAPSGSDGCP